MPIQANVTNQQITANVGETQIDVSVSGGVGPTGNSGTIAVSAPVTNAGTSTAAVIGLSTGTGLAVSAGSLTVSYGTTAGTACQGNDARLSDAREWSAATVSQADAEAGTSTSRFAFTPRRIFEAIAAWWAGSASKAKLDGIAAGATANATDAQLRDRATHTGTQLASTISDFTTAVVAAAPPTTNASLLTSGTLPDARLSGNIARTSDVSSAVASLVNSAPAALDTLNELAAALGNDASFSTTVTNALAAKAPINNPTFTGTVGGITKSMVGLGNVDNTSDASKPVSTAQAAADSAVASAAASDATSKANAAQAAAVQRANHTGTQAASTITGLAAVATSGSYSSLSGIPSTFAPSAHKSSHATGGSDALTASDIGAAAASHTHTVTDVSGAVSTSDSRLTDARTPTGAAGGDLTGTYPNPTIAPGAVVTADLADGAVTTAKINQIAAADIALSAVYDSWPVVISSAYTQTISTTCSWADVQLNRPLTTLAFTGSRSGTARRMRVTLRQDSFGRCVASWPANITWAAGSAPVLQTTANGYDTIELQTSDGGLTWTGLVVQSVAGTTVSYLDTFDRAAASSLGTASSGGTWTQRSGSLLITNGRATTPTSGGECIATIPSGITSGSHRVTATAYINETILRHDFSIIARAVSGSTFLLAQIAGNGGSKNNNTIFWKRVNGTYTQLALSNTALEWLPGAIYRISLDVTSTTISLSADGTTLLTHTLSAGDQTTFNSSFDVGLRGNVSAGGDIGGSQIDNLLVQQL